MSQQTQNLMKKISLAKVVLNMGVGQSGDPIEIGKKALEQITGKNQMRGMQKNHKEIGVSERENLSVLL